MRILMLGLMVAAGITSASAQNLRAGYAKADITPAEPIQMGGYDLRGTLSDGVHGNDRLYVRVLILDDGATRAAFVLADVIGVRGHDTWRAEVARAAGVPEANVLVGDVHNHAAPSPSPKGERSFDKLFAKAIVAAAAEASHKLEPVRIAAGTGVSRIGMNRRQVHAADTMSPITFDENNSSQSFGKYKTDKPAPIRELAGVVRLGANPAGAIDPDVQLVRIDTAAGKPLAVMIHYACHGTSLGGRNSKISGEWMGRMQAYVEKALPGVGSIYLQGAAGDVNPRFVGGLDGDADNIETTWALGEEIGREVVRVYRSLAPEPVAAPIRLTHRDILLPRQYRELFADFHKTTVTAPTTVLRLGDLMWVTFPGEMFHAIGQAVKAAEPVPHPHLMGYTNGSIGYFPERNAYAEGGYEVAVTHLDPAAEAIYLREVADVLKQMR